MEWILSGGTCRYVAMELLVREQSQSIADNQTVLYYELRGWYTTSDANYWYSDTQNDIVISVNNGAVFNRVYTSGIRVSIGTNHPVSNKLVITSGTVTVDHNYNGKKDCPVSWSFVTHWNPTVYTWKKSQTLELTQIRRASDISLSETSEEFGESISIAITSSYSGFTHNLRYSFEGESGTIKTNAGASTTWIVPTSLMSQIPNATQAKATIYCDTYSDETLIGTKSQEITLVVPASIVPSLTLAVSEAAYMPSDILLYVQKYSRLGIVNTASSQYGATIKSYETKVDGKTYNRQEVTTETLQSSGTLTVTSKVTDSRGRTVTETVTVNVLAYSPPKLTEVYAYRCTSESDDTGNETGEYICVKPRGTITGLSGQNAKTCMVYYKKTSETSYSALTLTMSDYALDTEYLIFPADINSGYDVYCQLSDSFESVQYYPNPVLSGSAFIDILLNDLKEKIAIAIGKIAELEHTMDIGWDVRIRRDLTIDGNVYGKLKALDEIKAQVASDEDFNDSKFCVPGAWSVRTNAIAQTLSNIPTPYAGTLYTYSANGAHIESAAQTPRYIIQEYQTYNSAHGHYKRVSILEGAARTWSGWSKTSGSADLSALSDTIAATIPTTKRWTVPTTVGAWSRVCRYASYGNLLLSVLITQSNQICAYTYEIGVSDSTATITQVSASGYSSNAELKIRVVRDSGSTGWVELYNAYGYNESATVTARCQLTKLSNYGTFPTVYTEYTAGSSYANPLAELISTPKGIKSTGNLSTMGSVITDAGVEVYGSTPHIDFHFADSSADYTARIIESSKGVLTAINSITSGSDKRLKKGIKDIPDVYMQLMDRLYPKLYRYKKGDDHLHAGLIAQDVLEIERELGITQSVLVRGTGERIPDPKHPGETMIDYFSIDYQALSVLMMMYVRRKQQDIRTRSKAWRSKRWRR